MSKPILAILGASGHGKVIADLAETLGFEVSFFDDLYPSVSKVENWTVEGTFDDLLAKQSMINMNVFVAIGNNKVRESKINYLIENNFNCVTLIHKDSSVSEYASIGKGSVILAGAVVNAFVKIGEGCIINSGAIVEHDCALSNFVHLSPNAALAGGVTIGPRTWVGLGVNVKELAVIGSDSIIGAGSTVIKNVASNVVAYGTPAVAIGNNL